MKSKTSFAVAWRPPLAHVMGIEEEGMLLTW